MQMVVVMGDPAADSWLARKMAGREPSERTGCMDQVLLLLAGLGRGHAGSMRMGHVGMELRDKAARWRLAERRGLRLRRAHPPARRRVLYRVCIRPHVLSSYGVYVAEEVRAGPV